MNRYFAASLAAGAVGRDLRLALRRLAREPGLAVAAILTLAVGIGACTSMFSIVQAVLLQPLGVTDPERVVAMWPQFDDTAGEFAYNTYRDMQRQTTAFERLAVTGSTNWSTAILLDGGTRLTATQCAVSGEFFDLLGAKASIGRTLQPEDDQVGARGVVVLSAAFSTKVFGADPRVVGKTLTVREKSMAVPYEIVGVMPPEFFYPSGADYWSPAAPALARAVDGHSPAALAGAFDHLGVFHALGRLKPGVSFTTAQADASRVLRAGADRAGAQGATIRAGAEPFLEHVFGHARLALAVLMGAVLLLLFVACANVAGLLLARGAARSREMAIRAALGATQWSLAQQSLSEAALLVAIGGTLGASTAALSLRALIALSPAAIPRLDRARIDLGVLAFTALIMATTTLLMGVAASWRLRDVSSAGHTLGSAKVVGRSVRAGVRQTLVVTQVSLALVVLVASALAVQSFVRVASLDLGFEPSHVLTFGVNGLTESRYQTYAARHRMVDQLLVSFEHLPLVGSAGAVLSRPFAHGVIGWDSGLLLDGQVNTPTSWLRNPTVNWEAVTPHYFQAMGIRLVRGRDFATEDSEHAPLVAIVSELTAARAWPGQNPVGKRLMDSFIGRFGDGPQSSRWQTVVGVVATSRYREIDKPWPDLYVPLEQAGQSDVEHFVVRTSRDPRSLLPTIAAALSAVDGGLSVAAPTTMDDVMAQVRAPWHFDMLLFSMFGAVSMGLTAVGVFGLMAYTVTWRRREIGLRIALGAREGQVVRMIILEGGRLVAMGLGIGLVASLWATHLMRGLLFNISPTDPTTLVWVCAGVLAVASVACYIPARRVAGMDPSIVFRDE